MLCMYLDQPAKRKYTLDPNRTSPVALINLNTQSSLNINQADESALLNNIAEISENDEYATKTVAVYERPKTIQQKQRKKLIIDNDPAIISSQQDLQTEEDQNYQQN